jgi:nucleotide-binding universal stress UspA family protein
MYERILIPTDGSDGAEAALEHGINLAEHYDAAVDLVYVVDEAIYEHYGGVDALEHAETSLEERGDEILTTARERVAAADLPVDTHVEHTTPAEGIVDVADAVDADLIVMGTEPRSTERRRFLGSVSERVARMSSLPVHLVKA